MTLGPRIALETDVTTAQSTAATDASTKADAAQAAAISAASTDASTKAAAAQAAAISASAPSSVSATVASHTTSIATNTTAIATNTTAIAALSGGGSNVLGTSSNPVTNPAAVRPTGLTVVWWLTATQPTNLAIGDVWENTT